MRDSVAVTGASGYVGRNLRRHLARRGVRAVCLTRGPLAARATEAVVAGPWESARAAHALRACRAMVHLAGVGRHSDPGGHAANAALAAAAVRACRRARVPKIVFVSGLGADSGATGYFASKLAAERAVSRSGIAHAIFRASYIMGRGDALSSKIRRMARAGTVAVPGTGRYLLQPIHVDDACAVLAGEALRPGSRRTLDLVGPERVTYARLAAALAGPGRLRRVPMESALREAARSARAPYDLDELAILAGGFVGDHERLRRAARIGFVGLRSML
ncbi:MAG: NAD-dependent epimerase/dehydratase family protein [Thaumarchaeota archaeon S13]|nr:MAG: NAD-dependent epimerase/dehydratase family protein [Thaumarchaeota archaeon S13]